ncbi:MAG: ABC transporter substrate-binding protein, partial [Rhodospirillales bacterium]|nr:ABC transporter substrate-binding protein [Rhodospirillales bacterium]
MHRRTLLSTIGAAAAMGAMPRAHAATVGVTKTEIKIGNIDAYSGPASAYGAIARGLTAYWKMVNDGGGIHGRKINFISLDDGYIPSKTVEQARRLVEQDQVAFLLNPLGTPTNSAIQKYMNVKKVPQLFVSTGADKFADYKHFPWTMGWQPSYRTEAQIYGQHILAEKPNAKIAILYQNDDFGKDYVIGLKEFLGKNYAKHVVKEASYEVTDPTIDSQAVAMKDSGADVVLTAATPKFAAQMIRKIHDLGWSPLHMLTNVSISVGSVINPAGPQNAVGIVTALYAKDPTDPAWANDAGMNEWRAFMKKYMPGADTTDSNYVFAYGVATTARQFLTQCGNNLSRENILKQVTNLHNLKVPTLLPGIVINTSP